MCCTLAVCRLSPHIDLCFHIPAGLYDRQHPPPLCTFAQPLSVHVRVLVVERGDMEMVLSTISLGGPLAELSSLAGTGYTAQLQGNHPAGDLRFHLSPIHSSTYLEQLSGCAGHKPRGGGVGGGGS